MAVKKPSARKKRLTARVTHLEMTTPIHKVANRPSRPLTALLRVTNMPAHFYRYLYEQIGRPHHWYERRVMTDDALKDILHNDNTHLEVLYADGAPAGYFELSLAQLPEAVELVYFGLVPDFQGLNLGKWFLSCAIRTAWDCGPKKITVHTNTLDHPSALSLYQKMGFSPVSISKETVTVWED